VADARAETRREGVARRARRLSTRCCKACLTRTKWIGSRNAQRKRALAQAETGFLSAQLLGLLALGVTSVYREGLETVLFLQSLQLKAGTTTVLEGVALGLVGTAAVGFATLFLQRKLPYRRMLMFTGVLVGVVLVVMVGGSARTLVGSYFLAEYVKVRAPRRRGEDPAVRTSEPSLQRQ
jgi:Iron permease FTR1 family